MDAGSCPEETPVTREDIWGRLHVAVDVLDMTHGLIRLDGRSLQISISGSWSRDRMRLLTGALAQHSSAQLQALAGFHAIVKGHRWPSGTFPPDNRAKRHLIVCKALDGRLEGLNERQIAEQIFGASRVNADWSDPCGCLRDQTRRAVRRGIHLMQGGYLSLLT